MRWLLIIVVLVVTGLVAWVVGYPDRLASVRDSDRLRELQVTQEGLEYQLEELEAERDGIYEELEVALDSIDKLTSAEVQERIVVRYRDRVRLDTVVRVESRVVLDSLVGNLVLRDLEEFDFTKVLLENCQSRNINLARQLEGVKDQAKQYLGNDCRRRSWILFGRKKAKNCNAIRRKLIKEFN